MWSSTKMTETLLWWHNNNNRRRKQNTGEWLSTSWCCFFSSYYYTPSSSFISSTLSDSLVSTRLCRYLDTSELQAPTTQNLWVVTNPICWTWCIDTMDQSAHNHDAWSSTNKNAAQSHNLDVKEMWVRYLSAHCVFPEGASSFQQACQPHSVSCPHSTWQSLHIRNILCNR